jgi:8-amino-7-oxononanoate synthase
MNPYLPFEHELAELKDKDLYRSLKSLTMASDNPTHMKWQGKELVLFCSNDYLGLSRDVRVIRALQEAAATYGAGSGASRLISGTTEWHTRLEDEITRFKNKESALLFSSGFLANVGIITAVTDKASLIIIDKLNHASIVDAAHLSRGDLRVYPHKDMRKLEALLKTAKGYSRVLIVSDSVFSMDGDCAPLCELVELKKKYGALLMIDEAHATGVFGARGSGLAEALECEADIDFLMGTLSKGVGILGGYCAMNKVFSDYMINKSRAFIYTTSLPAHICAAACEAIRIIESERKLRDKLWQTIVQVRGELQRQGFDTGKSESPIIPVIVGSEAHALAMSKALFDEGFYIPAVRYPTVPKGKARLRITLSCAHREEDILRLLNVFKKIKKC